MSDATDAAIAQLQADVTALSDKEAAAITLLNGLAQQLKDALIAAANAGATPAQLAALNELHATIASKTADLAAAIVADTPAPPVVEPPPPPPPPVPVTITTTSLSDGTVGSSYSATLAATGGTGPVTWASSPPSDNGLTVNSSGTVTGTPVAEAVSTFSVTATDSTGASASASLTVHSVAAPVTFADKTKGS